MKKYLIALSLLLTLGTSVPTVAQTPQKQEQQELVDSAAQDQLEAFSDTTLAEADSVITRNINLIDEWDDEDAGPLIKKLLKEIDGEDIAGMFFALFVILIIFVIKSSQNIVETI